MVLDMLFPTCTDRWIEHNLVFEHAALVCFLEECQCHQSTWLLHASADRSTVAISSAILICPTATITSSDRSSFPKNTPSAFHRDSTSQIKFELILYNSSNLSMTRQHSPCHIDVCNLTVQQHQWQTSSNSKPSFSPATAPTVISH